MANAAKVAPAGELSAERVMCIVRIILSSPALRQAALEFRANAVDVELAKRMGASVRRSRPEAGVCGWGFGDHDGARPTWRAETRDWSQLSIDDVAERLERTFAEFSGLTAGNRQSVVTIWQPPRGRQCWNGTTF